MLFTIRKIQGCRLLVHMFVMSNRAVRFLAVACLNSGMLTTLCYVSFISFLPISIFTFHCKKIPLKFSKCLILFPVLYNAVFKHGGRFRS